VTPQRVVVSGVDGGLLDPTRGWDGARPALAVLARLRLPLVLCSTRPRAELAVLSRLFGLDAPMIVENGAALLVPHGHLPSGLPDLPSDGSHHVLALGPGRDALLEELAELARAAGVRVRGVSDLTPQERFRGSALGRLADSTSRYEYTEPFLLETAQDEAALAVQAERRGLRIVHGPRYLHLCDGGDKGLAVRTLLSLYERSGPLPRAIGIGAWPTDVSMLRAVHRAVILPTGDRALRREIAAAVPRAVRARIEGADGWSDAVIAELTGREPATARSALARSA
jgi:mannosyl-3-phosphoglycerate phosphatase